MNSGGRFGNTLRDDIFQFRLDNETGSTLTVTNVGSTYTVSLLSKNGDDLGHGSFNIGGTTALSTVVLDSANKRLVFTLADGSVLYCDLTAIYTLIDTKQSTLGINPTTTTDNLTGLTINGTSYAIKSEPDAYIKNAAVANEKLTLTKKDDTTVELDVSGKVDKPNEPVQGLGVNVPYYFSVDYSADKATVTDYTIDLLDKTKAPQTFTLDINTATTTTAGLESASDKTKLDAIESGAQVNNIETIKVNGTEQAITDKSVDIAVPTKTSDLTDDIGFVKKVVGDVSSTASAVNNTGSNVTLSAKTTSNESFVYVKPASVETVFNSSGTTPIFTQTSSGLTSRVPVTIPTTPTANAHATSKQYVDTQVATKQDTISDLETIRSGAALGATALQEVPSTYRTAAAQDTIDAGFVKTTAGTLPNASVVQNTGNHVTISATEPNGTSYILVYPSYIETKFDNADILTQTSSAITANVPVTVPTTPTANGHATSKQYVDTQDTAISDRVTTIEGKESTWDAKQDALVSGSNIKTINNESVLGSGNISYRTDLSADDTNAPTTTAVRAFVNSSISAIAANYVTSTAAGDNFATKAILLAATTFYHSGVVYTPTKNDYVVVASDEDHDNKQARYINTSDTTTPSWSFQYTLGSTFTAAQQAAIDSGATSTKIGSYDTHIADGTIHVTSSDKTTWNAKQNALSDAQLAATNSGITTSKVATYDGYSTGKQDTLTAGSNIQITGTTISATDTTYTAGTNVQINNNVISATDTTYESKAAASGGTDVSLVTTGEKYTWNNKQDALTAGSGISIDSNVISAELTYEEELDTPTVTSTTPGTLTVTEVSGASSYKVYAGSTEIGEVTA